MKNYVWSAATIGVVLGPEADAARLIALWVARSYLTYRLLSACAAPVEDRRACGIILLGESAVL